LPQWVGGWLQSRMARQEKKAESDGSPSALAPEAAATAATQARKREEKRDDKVGAGMQELQTWIHDRAREGLASVRPLRGIVLCEPGRVNGLVVRACGGVRGGPGEYHCGQHVGGGVRHGRGRPDAAAGGSGRGPVRHAAGGATDINRALAYCQGPVTRPQDDFRADQRPLRRRQQCRDAGARGGAGWGAACR
jgi:hypothetical protein